ncbi:MAG: M24 family metallopeptidase [Acidobacteriota bacterium]|nr:M24 family metallopeptidase [Acidobacteriota bacterium]
MNEQSEIEIKTERLRRMLVAENLNGILINAQHNFAWLTGGKSNGINLSVENGSCFLLVCRDGKKFVLANNIEMNRLLTEEISADEFEPVEFPWEDEKVVGDFVFERAKSLLDGNGEIASDLPLSAKVRAIENLIAPCRFEFTAAETERYRKLGRDAGAALRKIFQKIEPGETELEIARKVRDALAVYHINSIVTLVGADERTERFRHPIPTDKRWRKVVLIGICAKREGLIVNFSRIACVGEIPGELDRKTDAVAHVFARMIAATRIGASGAELYQATAKAYAEQGFADEIQKHHQGGATGYKTREWLAHPKSAEIVLKNQAFAWNPTITGTKAEETFVVTENGAEILTTSPDFPSVSIEINGREFQSPGILSL